MSLIPGTGIIVSQGSINSSRSRFHKTKSNLLNGILSDNRLRVLV